MPDAERTRKGGTITTEGIIPHKLIRAYPVSFFAPVRVIIPPDRTELPIAMKEDGQYVYAMPGEAP